MPELLRLRVNGIEREVEAWPMERLLDVLRDRLGLTGTKEGCGEGECGACAVLLGGRLVNSCLVPAIEAAGREVTTIEGLESSAVAASFVRNDAVQCGMCAPGMIVAVEDAVRHGAKEDEMRERLAGNLCRCTGYRAILEAAEEAAR